MHKTDRNFMLALAAIGAVLVGGPVAATAYNNAELRTVYEQDWMFPSGAQVIMERQRGKLGLESGKGKVVGYFLSGRPRVVGFGCEGHDAPLIAMEEDLLPRCERVEGIRQPKA